MYQFNLITQTRSRAGVADIYIDIDGRTQIIGTIAAGDLTQYSPQKLEQISRDVSQQMGLVYVPAQRNSVDAIQIAEGSEHEKRSFNLSHEPDFIALCDKIKSHLPKELTQQVDKISQLRQMMAFKP